MNSCETNPQTCSKDVRICYDLIGQGIRSSDAMYDINFDEGGGVTLDCR